MANFLDKDGLSHLWTLIKNKLDKKQDTIWEGTHAEYEAQKDSIPDGTYISFTDDSSYIDAQELTQKIEEIDGKIDDNTSDISTLNGNVSTNTANIATLNGLVSNPNLLDNGWFTVDQRGAQGVPANWYGVDRWKNIYLNDSASIVLTTNGLKFNTTTFNDNCLIEQYIKKSDFDASKGFTMSIMLSDGTIYSFSGTSPDASDFDNSVVNFHFHSTNDTHYRARVWAKTTITVRAVKLEYGLVSTLSNDNPPNYSDELLRCQGSMADSSDTYANRPNVPIALSTTSLTNCSWNGKIHRIGNLCIIHGVISVTDTSQNIRIEFNKQISNGLTEIFVCNYSGWSYTDQKQMYLYINGNSISSSGLITYGFIKIDTILIV